MEWWEIILRLGVSVLLGGIIGVERERRNRPAGMRTHVLVCVGATVIAVLESLIMSATIEINQSGDSTGIGVSLGRMSAQVISGIGFLGAGTIFIAKKRIAGLTTAASLWNSACIGLAIGMGYYILGISACLIVIVVLALLPRGVHVTTLKNVEVMFIHRVETLAFINTYFQEMGVKVLDVDFHVENKEGRNLYTNLYSLDMPSHTSYVDIVNRLSEHTNIQSVRTRNM